MKRRKLSNRLALIYAVLFGAVFFLLSAGVLFSTCQTLLHDKREYLFQTMSIVKSHILEEIDEGDPLTEPDLLLEQSFDLNLNMIVYLPNGQTVNKLRNFHMVPEDLPAATDAIYTVFTRQDGVLLSYRSELTAGDTVIGALLLVSKPVNEVGYVKLLGMQLIGANLIGVVAAAFVGRYASRRMLAPIDGMIREAAEINSQTLKKRLPEPEPDDELRRLAVTINTMLERVENAFEQQCRFSADASHELRTPLAVIRGYVDLLQRWGKSDQRVLQEGLDAVSRQTEYMQKLVETLLLLSRGDSGQWEMSRKPFDVTELLHELVKDQSSLDMAHRYELCPGDNIMLFGDKQMIRQMLLALLDNSRKYTPEGGVITTGAERSDGEINLSVCDTGIGIEQEQLQHIFERFYRADKSRSRKDGSAGLGLSIVAAIADLHEASVHASSVPGSGTSIQISFPDIHL